MLDYTYFSRFSENKQQKLLMESSAKKGKQADDNCTYQTSKSYFQFRTSIREKEEVYLWQALCHT